MFDTQDDRIKINRSDQAYFVNMVDGKLLAKVCLHVDDLLMAGENEGLMESIQSE